MKPNILIIDDEESIRWMLSMGLKTQYSVTTADSVDSAIKCIHEKLFDLALIDIRLPDGTGVEILELIKKSSENTTIIMMSAFDDISTAVECMKKGAYDYIHKPFGLDEILLIIKKTLHSNRTLKDFKRMLKASKSVFSPSNIIAKCDKMKGIFNILDHICETSNTTVLVEGESGTGKELIASYIHYNSDRAECPFIQINCGSIVDSLFESELFGHEKNSFTGANERKLGLFEVSNHGTLFLDEIGEMDFNSQAKLLRAIENRTFRRVGGTQNIDFDVRIIAATNRSLFDEVKKKNFREDLFYRLNVFPIVLPPLRERNTDIIEIAEHFIRTFNQTLKKRITGLSSEAKTIILSYEWPGNIRELRNIIERAMILTPNQSEITPEKLLIRSTELNPKKNSSSQFTPGGIDEIRPLHLIEQEYILSTLKFTDNNNTKTAILLGISLRTLQRKLQQYKAEGVI